MFSKLKHIYPLVNCFLYMILKLKSGATFCTDDDEMMMMI